MGYGVTELPSVVYCCPLHIYDRRQSMKPQEEIAKLQKENAALQEQIKGLQNRVKELEAAKPKSKSRDIAEKTLEMLKRGPVTVAQLAALNPKYPSDCIYYVRT